MIVAGFDPGSNVFGVGIVQKDNTGFSLIMSEEIFLPKTGFSQKMITLMAKLRKILETYHIDEMAIEDGFLGKNVSSMNTLSKVRGVVLATVLDQGKELYFYSPREIKSAVTGNGNARKEQVKKSLEMILKLNNHGLGLDESDAIASAMCHLMTKRKEELLR
jgi:crossover junction endodeoxyribonuclease RuvC